MNEKLTTKNSVKELKALLEQKNRELEIEAALEKIRSRSLAMHKSDELQEIVNIVFEKLVDLKVETDVVSVIILKDNLDEMEYWVANSKQINPVMYRIIHNEDILILKDVMISRKKEIDFSKDYTFEEKNQLWEYLYMYSDFKNTPNERKNFVLNTPAYTTSVSFAKNTAVQLNRYYKKSFTDDEKQILKRITRVFEQAYTRFLDLQKAEAQTREAEIQLALERVRARTMAMHKSDELAETVAHLFNQLEELGIKPYRCNLAIVDQDKEHCQLWSTTNEGNVIPFAASLPLTKSVMKEMYEGWKKQKHSIQKIIGNKRLEWINYLNNYVNFKEYKAENIDLDKLKKEPAIFNTFSFKQGFFVIHTITDLKETDLQIIQRFAKVFEQTYTRFLDLQKAEAQAREAQIEVALERIRARSMAMHKSDELIEVVNLVFQQLKLLNVSADTTYIHTDVENREVTSLWIANESYARLIHIPNFQHRVNNSLFKAMDNKISFIADSFSVEEKNSYFEHAFKYSDLKDISQKRKKFVLDGTSYYRSTAINKYSSISTINYYGNKLSHEENEILIRFAKVFEQAYTRFLDLKKAEAQAREAQIEAALERIRSRTMGMQQSEELSDVATVLFRQLSSLGVQLWSCGFVLTDDENESEFRMTNPEGEIEPPLYIPNDVDPATRNMYFHWKEGDSYFAEIMEGDALKNHYDILLSLPKSGPVFQEILDTGNQFPLWQQNHAAYFSHGYLIFITTEPFEDQNLLERFAKVFEQTYTRFLDLQKAEAQAWEAQIEAALERVRASSMAMHKSEELVEVVRTLDKELNGLGIEINGTQIITDFSKWKEGLNSWYALEGQAYLEKFHVPHTDLPLLNRFVKAIQKGLTFYTENITKSEKDKSFKWFYRYSDFSKLPNDRQEFVYSAPGWVRATVISGNSALVFQRLNLNVFTKEEENIFKRFGKVFEQSYTRFLDLKKAEAQAREAQIEAALERVRSRSLAMQSANELGEVVKVIVEKLLNLGVVLDANGVILCTYFDNSKDVLHWIVSPDFSMAGSYLLPYFDHPIFSASWHSKEIGDEYFIKKIFSGRKEQLF